MLLGFKSYNTNSSPVFTANQQFTNVYTLHGSSGHPMSQLNIY